MGQRSGNETLRSCLAALGWTPERLAREVTRFAQLSGVQATVSDKAPYNWLAGAVPYAPVRELVAALLSERLARTVTMQALGWYRGRSSVHVRADDSLDGLTLTLGGAMDALALLAGDDMERRVFLTVSGMALAAATHDWLIDTDHIAFLSRGGRAGDGLVRDLESVLAARRRLDDQVGGVALYDVLVDELRLVNGMLRRGGHGERVTRQLLAVSAEFAQMAGHAAYDAERHGLAQRYYLAGLHAARESGDRALGAHILGCMGQQATHQGQLGDAERLFLAARSGAGGSLSAAESGNLCALLARVYARRGERVLVERYANEAMEYAAGARADEAPAWIYWCDTTMITALVGEAYLAATHTMGPGQGIGEKAEQRLQIGCDGFDPTERPRERAMWTLFRADACIARGDQEQASLLVRKATTLAETVQSTHLTHHIGELRAALA